MYIFNWIRHVEGWLKQPVHFVKYEDMHYCFQETMTEVFKVLDEKRIKFRRPKFGEHYSKNNIQRKGIVGDWKNHFKKADLKHFNSLAGDLMIRLGYEGEP